MPEITDSGNLASADWNEGIMTVRFKKGGVYEYYDVSYALFTELMAAQSKSQFLKTEIIGKFEYARV
jgi:hypothetical protein